MLSLCDIIDAVEPVDAWKSDATVYESGKVVYTSGFVSAQAVIGGVLCSWCLWMKSVPVREYWDVDSCKCTMSKRNLAKLLRRERENISLCRMRTENLGKAAKLWVKFVQIVQFLMFKDWISWQNSAVICFLIFRLRCEGARIFTPSARVGVNRRSWYGPLWKTFIQVKWMNFSNSNIHFDKFLHWCAS